MNVIGGSGNAESRHTSLAATGSTMAVVPKMIQGRVVQVIVGFSLVSESRRSELAPYAWFWITIALLLLMALGRFFLGLVLAPFAGEFGSISMTPGVLWRGVLLQIRSWPHILSVLAAVPCVILVMNRWKAVVLARYVVCVLLILVVRNLVFSVWSRRASPPDLNELFFAFIAPYSEHTYGDWSVMRKPKVLTQAFTLLELLTVIAIILILSAIMLSVSMQGVKSAKLTTCISNLRSIGQAVELYSSDNSNRIPDNIYVNYDAIVQYSKADVFRCPVDQTPFAFQGAPTVTATPSSYFPLPAIPEGFEQELRSKDENFTVFVCLLHGKHERTGVILSPT